MSYVVLARKYRPRTFGQMVGQDAVVQALSSALKTQRLHHAYLFTGTRGIGKTTISRILAKSLNCIGPQGSGGITDEPCGMCSVCRDIDADRFVDYVELDAASNRSIDEIRDLLERAAYKPSVGRFKVFMIDEAHQLTKDSFNALLKTLEEPPDYLKFVLATTDPQKMLPTVLSRCLQFNLRAMTPEVVAGYLRRVLEEEGVAFEADALELLGHAARGSMRDGLSLTDQALAYGQGQLTTDGVRAMIGAPDDSLAAEWIYAVASHDAARVLAVMDDLRAAGQSANGTLEWVARQLQLLALEQMLPGSLAGAEASRWAALAASWDRQEAQLLYQMVLTGRQELAVAPDEYAALQMLAWRFIAFSRGASSAVPTAPKRRALLRPQGARLQVDVPTVERVSETPAPAAQSAQMSPAGWLVLMQQVLDGSSPTGLLRELIIQSAWENEVRPDQWQLRIPRDSLGSEALIQRLAEAVTAALGRTITLRVTVGTVEESLALQWIRQREAQQAAAVAVIEGDPLVQSLLQQYPSARVLNDSIRPIGAE